MTTSIPRRSIVLALLFALFSAVLMIAPAAPASAESGTRWRHISARVGDNWTSTYQHSLYDSTYYTQWADYNTARNNCGSRNVRVDMNVNVDRVATIDGKPMVYVDYVRFRVTGQSHPYWIVGDPTTTYFDVHGKRQAGPKGYGKYFAPHGTAYMTIQFDRWVQMNSQDKWFDVSWTGYVGARYMDDPNCWINNHMAFYKK